MPFHGKTHCPECSMDAVQEEQGLACPDTPTCIAHVNQVAEMSNMWVSTALRFECLDIRAVSCTYLDVHRSIPVVGQ